MKTSIIWKGNRLFMGHASTGHQVLMDGPAGFGGNDAGVRPMELLLIGLGGCGAFDVVSILDKKRMLPDSLEVTVEGERCDDHPRVYTDIRIHYHVSGEKLTEDAVAKAIALSETKFCSVSAMLGQTAKITTSFTLFREGSE